MTTTYHKEHPADHAAVLAMRAELRLYPALQFRPEAHPFFDALMAATPAAKGVVYEAATLGGIAGWWCWPEDAVDGAAILYLHGGAYVLGSATAYRNFAGQISERAKASTFIADYRLAPEDRFPSAVDDGFAVYRDLSRSGFSRLALAGDSAGGGLALVLLSIATAALRAGSVLRPAAAAVISPWTDLAVTGDSIEGQSNADPLLTREALEKAAGLYLGEHDRRGANASPLYGDLTGLPPILLHVGEDKILLDDSRRFAEKIEAAGGLAQLNVWQGMVHVFPSPPFPYRSPPHRLQFCSIWLFEANPCRLAPEDLPPSQVQHRALVSKRVHVTPSPVPCRSSRIRRRPCASVAGLGGCARSHICPHCQPGFAGKDRKTYRSCKKQRWPPSRTT